MDEILEGAQATVPTAHPAEAGGGVPGAWRWRRVLQVGAAVGLAAGIAVGATALAEAASSGGTTPPSSSAPKSGSGSGHAQGHHFMFGFRGGFGGGPGAGFGSGFGGFGQVIHGVYTVKGPKGYETIEIQTGTVTSLKDVSGNTWSLVVTSTDKTALTYTVDSGTSVNGGETGISTVKTGDQVTIQATISAGTATAKNLLDMTKLQANRTSWAPPMAGGGSGGPGGANPSGGSPPGGSAST
jgi:hypothetical protein